MNFRKKINVLKDKIIKFGNKKKISKSGSKGSATSGIKEEKIVFYGLNSTEIDPESIYIKALEYSIDDNEIFNIAITGLYGSGKTSILKTYKNKHQEKKILNISLASFKDNDMDNGTSIERSILQQIFYTMSPKKIPYSRFKRINKLSKKDVIKKLLAIIFTIIAIIGTGYLLWNPQIVNWQSFGKMLEDVRSQYFYGFFKSVSTIILMVFFGGSILFALYAIYKKATTTIELSNLKLKKESIEIGLKKKDINCDSIFDKYLDELIYFFETTDYEIVVIEDLDRFKNCNEVFIKLREINILINKCESINRKIKFIYAIKDDLFIDKERTKFFEFMIPVIPVINSANSREKLLEKLRENNLENYLKLDYIKDITLYIDDMRVLNNIINEFNIYRKNLKISNLIPEKLFSIVVLKNLYPKIFSDLQEKKGILWEVFSRKEERIKEYKKKLQSLEEELKIKKINLELCKDYSYKTLKRMLWAQIIGIAGRNRTQILINGKEILEDDFASDSYKIEDMKNAKIIMDYYHRTFEYAMSKIPKKDRLDIDTIDENMNIEENEEKIEEIEGEITDIEEMLSKIMTIQDYSIVNLIREFGIENILTEQEDKNDFIRFLLSSGNLSEDYEEYINYFYEGSLKQGDKEFLINVKSKRKTKYDYPLIEKKEIMDNLSIRYFKELEILNFELLDYILEKDSIYASLCQELFLQFKRNSDETIEFCTQYIERDKNTEKFIRKLCKYWKEIWLYIQANYSEEKRSLYLCSIVKYIDISNINQINKEDALANYISKERNFIKMFKTSEEILGAKRVVNLLHVKFEQLDEKDLTFELGEYIIDNNHYVINEHMIDAILRQKYKINEQDIQTRNYTSIIHTQDSSLLNYINENLGKYITNVLLSENKSISDEEVEIIKLLNYEEITLDQKEKIIERLKTSISNIKNVNVDLWETLIKNDKIRVSWDNVISYYLEKQLSNELISYINSNYQELIKEEIDASNAFNEETYQSICDALAEEETVVKEIIKSLSSYTVGEQILTLELSDERIAVMIEEGILPVKDTTYKLLKDNYKQLISKYMAKNISFFIEEQEYLEYDEDNIKDILEDNDIAIEDKLSIIESLEESIICNNIKDANMYYSLIMSDKRDIIISINLLKSMIEYLEEEKSLRLIINQSQKLGEDTITECLLMLGYPYNEIPTKSIPKIRKNNLTEKFIEMLRMKKISYISSIRERGEYYIVYKRRK